jgi:hypothetical protein
MTPLLLSFLLLFTIAVVFVFGISVGYWAVCGILYFFNPSRSQNTSAHRSVLAPYHSGD